MMNKNTEKGKKNEILNEIITVAWGSFFNALGLSVIMVPNGLTYGGIAGLARLLQNFIGLNSYSLLYYLMAMGVVVLVWITLGFKEVRKIIAMSFAVPALMAIFERFNTQIIIDDTLMAAILFGVTIGVANGGMFLGGYSSGGTDSIAKVLKCKLFPYVGISKLTFALDFMIIVGSAFIMGINVALYAMVSIFASMKICEAVMYGFQMKLIELSILTSIPEQVSDYIMHDIIRGVTSVDTVGEFTGEHKKQLKVICSPRESFEIKRYLAANDPQAFVVVNNISAVWGNGKGFTDMTEQEIL